MGRPSLYSPELLAVICERLGKGEPLAAICRDEGMPDRSTIWDWEHDESRPEVSQRIARAREDGEDVIAADCLRIADTPCEGVIEKSEMVAKPRAAEAPADAAPEFEMRITEIRREDMLGHRKLQIDTRLKLLAKFNPKRWGEKAAVELTGKDGGPIKTVSAQLSVDPTDAARVYQEMMQGNP